MHLVPLFELAYPFQIEVLFLVLQILVHCRYDAFIAPKLCFTKVIFQFWEQIEVRRGHIRRIWGMRKDFESAFSRSQSWQLATCKQAYCPARAEQLESIFFSCFLQFPGTTASVLLHNMHLFSCDLVQDIQS